MTIKQKSPLLKKNLLKNSDFMNDLFNRFFHTRKVNGVVWIGIMLDLDEKGNCLTQIIARQEDGKGTMWFYN